MKEVDEVKAIDASLRPIPGVVYERIVKMHKDMLYQEWDGRERAQFIDSRLFTIWQYRGDYQICRLMQCRIKWWKRREQMDVVLNDEVARWYLNVNSLNEHHFYKPYYYATRDFAHHRDIRYVTRLSDFGQYVANICGYPVSVRLHSKIRRNGLKVEMMKCVEQDAHIKSWNDKSVVKKILAYPMAETVVKSKYWRLIGVFEPSKQSDIVKLVIRNNVKIEQSNWSMLVDAVNMMEEENIDWHNGKILTDWLKYHDMITKRRLKREEERRRRQEYEELMKQMNEERDFLASHAKWLGISWNDCDMVFSVLSSINDYFEEGQAMHHCIFSNHYWRNPVSVIVSVKDADGNRLATIEWNAKYDNVVQCRAKYNGVPERYNEIIESFNKNKKKYGLFSGRYEGVA